MAKSVTRRSDLLEREYEAGLSFVIRGVIVLCVSLILVWILTLVQLQPLVILAWLGVAAGVVLAAFGARRMVVARKLPAVSVKCPYCDFTMQFPAEPTTDYDCEQCHRRVYFEGGKQAEVLSLTCDACRTEHRVSVQAQRFVCDRCNRPLRMPGQTQAPRSAPGESDPLRNYDVVLTQVGRQPTEVALAVQDLLVCNLPEARRRLQDLPLTVTRGVYERKADAIRRRLRDLGATAVIRPSQEQTTP
ncbi:MAG TPA: ribosomal protein L7/L12 [Chthonomonadales bacterium]|nr:ribosomal protein L7/L12 [Chthonomonadales bacterium]